MRAGEANRRSTVVYRDKEERRFAEGFDRWWFSFLFPSFSDARPREREERWRKKGEGEGRGEVPFARAIDTAYSFYQNSTKRIIVSFLNNSLTY